MHTVFKDLEATLASLKLQHNDVILLDKGRILAKVTPCVAVREESVCGGGLTQHKERKKQLHTYRHKFSLSLSLCLSVSLSLSFSIYLSIYLSNYAVSPWLNVYPHSANISYNGSKLPIHPPPSLSSPSYLSPRRPISLTNWPWLDASLHSKRALSVADGEALRPSSFYLPQYHLLLCGVGNEVRSAIKHDVCMRACVCVCVCVCVHACVCVCVCVCVCISLNLPLAFLFSHSNSDSLLKLSLFFLSCVRI